MKKLLVLLLAVAFLSAFASCASVPEDTTKESTTSAPTPSDATTTITPPPLNEVENPIAYLNFYYVDASGTMRYISFYTRDGGFDLEHQGDVKKVASFEGESSAFLDAAFLRSALIEFNGQSIYEGEGAHASMYVQFKDNSYIAADFSGTIPEGFVTGYQVLEAEIETFMQNVPVYVPKPIITGLVDADALAEIEAIMKSANYEAPDSFYISDIPLDDFFELKTYLSSKDGIVNATELNPLRQPSAFSLIIVTVENEAMIDTLHKDFASDIPWNKWVCVGASNAAIAKKGNMILCLLGTGNVYATTESALTAEGWTILETLKNRP